MNIVVANPPGRFSENRYPCPFPSRWTSLIPNYPVFTFFPYELAYMTSLLKREMPKDNIKMIDGTRLRYTAVEYTKHLLYLKPDYLIFETDTVTYAETMKIAKAVKEKCGTKIIMTGQYSTIFPQKVLADGNDYACIGEYEGAVLEILQGVDVKTIAGLYPNSYRELLDIDWLPDPEDEDIRRIDYSYSGGCRWTKYRSVEIHASRGCPYSCDFCVAGTVYYKKPNWRLRSTNRIIGELETLRKKYPQIEGVFFNEETHVVKKKPIMELCQAIIDSGNNDLHFEAMANHLLLDEELLVKLREAGYYKLRIGIETIDPETSKSIGRKSKPDRLYSLLGVAKKLGMEMYGTFIMGASGSSKEGDRSTIEYGKKLISQGKLSSWQASIAVPHPGTPFYKKAKENGWFNTTDYENFNGVTGTVLNYPNYSSKEIMENVNTVECEFEEARPEQATIPARSLAGEKTWLSKEKKAEVRPLLKKLTALFDAEKNSEVIDEADKILSTYPYLLRAMHLKASSCERLGDYKKARELFNKIIELCDDYNDALEHGSAAHFHLGWMLQMEGNKLEAVNHFKETMHLNPNQKLARRLYWILEFPDLAKDGEDEFLLKFKENATADGKIPAYVSLSSGDKS